MPLMHSSSGLVLVGTIWGQERKQGSKGGAHALNSHTQASSDDMLCTAKTAASNKRLTAAQPGHQDCLAWSDRRSSAWAHSHVCLVLPPPCPLSFPTPQPSSYPPPTSASLSSLSHSAAPLVPLAAPLPSPSSLCLT